VIWQVASWHADPNRVTVGDTVVLEREVVVTDPAAGLNLQPLESSDLLESLAAPQLIRAADGFVARYTMALFQPGEHTIEMPDLELLYADGRTETLMGGTAFLTVLSVLPESDSLPPLRAFRPPVMRNVTRTIPTALLVISVVALTTVWGAVRRRSQPRPAWERVDDADDPPVMRWIAAGEHRAVATVATHRVRSRVARLLPQAGQSLHIEEWLQVIETQRPDWPQRNLGDVMRALERASFAPAIPSDVIALADEVETLLQLLEPKEAEQQ
jgi:hypothetical protein